MVISHIESWAATNNLRLIRAKSKEIIFTARGNSWQVITVAVAMSEVPNIERVATLRVLGVIVNDRLTATDHVDNLYC